MSFINPRLETWTWQAGLRVYVSNKPGRGGFQDFADPQQGGRVLISETF